ncbi:hypothetical protein GUJ93_ZPchr0010g10838 [Zizania palustris]|uniref:Uncharacterized protein n=1 Tax=Zizania palustris TaxID=103762 RepID=A0A8J5WFE8_ZIZPA|nr:hypothetical protein GUJ93_ZPchr0010g10838 [Zizania palustris]
MSMPLVVLPSKLYKGKRKSIITIVSAGTLASFCHRSVGFSFQVVFDDDLTGRLPARVIWCRQIELLRSPLVRALNQFGFSSSSCSISSESAGRRRRAAEMVVMGQLGRFVDGIKSKLRTGGGKRAKKTAAAAYDKVDKTDSMRLEIRSRQAQKLIAKNLVAADSVGRRNKRLFLAF